MKRIGAKITLSGIILAMLVGCNSQANEQAPQAIAGNEMAAMTRLRAIASAEMRYQADSGGSYATLDELIEKRFVGDPSKGKLTGYRFEVRVRPGGFEATAVPVQFGISGKRSFYVDETRIMRGADKRGAQAASSDPEV